MAQLRQDYQRFTQRSTEILVAGPDDHEAFRVYWQEHDVPFIGLADPDNQVAELYEQEVSLLKLGRMPALMVVDKHGQLRLRHHADWMWDIPSNEEVLALLDEINQAEAMCAQTHDR